MVRRLLPILLCLLVTAGLLAEAGLVLLTPRERVRGWLQLLVARQIADTLRRTVRLGPVDGNLITGVVARDLAVWEHGGKDAGVLLRAGRIQLHYNLRAILGGEVAPAAGIDRVTTLSDYRDAEFGMAFGVLIKELRLLARTVFVLDREGTVRYVQWVNEITNEPDYDAVLDAVKKVR